VKKTERTELNSTLNKNIAVDAKPNFTKITIAGIIENEAENPSI
jgi:hypothetical protein